MRIRRTGVCSCRGEERGVDADMIYWLVLFVAFSAVLDGRKNKSSNSNPEGEQSGVQCGSSRILLNFPFCSASFEGLALSDQPETQPVVHRNPNRASDRSL